MGDKMFSSPFDNIQPFEDYRDFTFVVDGKAFKIHRIIFACEYKSSSNLINKKYLYCFNLIPARSNAFINIFKSHPKEAMIDDVSAEIFDTIVKYVYTGEVSVTDKNQADLLAAGEKFGLREVNTAVQLHRNLKMEPLRKKELENLKHKFDEAKYVYENTRSRYAIKNPFSQPPNVYY